LREWTKPDNHGLVGGAVADATRSKSELMLENALLRQQLIVWHFPQMCAQCRNPRPLRKRRVNRDAGRGFWHHRAAHLADSE
jgi:hypothetical protein